MWWVNYAKLNKAVAAVSSDGIYYGVIERGRGAPGMLARGHYCKWVNGVTLVIAAVRSRRVIAHRGEE